VRNENDRLTFAARVRMISCNALVSFPDSAAVGSSITTMDALRERARMISTFCWSQSRACRRASQARDRIPPFSRAHGTDDETLVVEQSPPCLLLHPGTRSPRR